MEEKLERLGQLIDKVDNLAHALEIPMPAHMHVDSLKTLLPEVVKELKESFVEISGTNPWN
jgi:hypothetical protein